MALETEHRAIAGLAHDEAQVAAHSHRPKILVARVVELMEAHARIDRVHVQIERSGFSELLLVAGQSS